MRDKWTGEGQSMCVNPLFLSIPCSLHSLIHPANLWLLLVGQARDGPWRHREESSSASAWCGEGPPCSACPGGKGGRRWDRACSGPLRSTWQMKIRLGGLWGPANRHLKTWVCHKTKTDEGISIRINDTYKSKEVRSSAGLRRPANVCAMD